MRNLTAVLVIGMLYSNLAVVSLRAETGPDRDQRQKLNDGYSLLYHLCDDEKSLELILMIKTTPPEVAAYAKQVSKAAKDQLATLEQLQEQNRSLRFDKVSLPQIELDVRASIKAEKQHQLLFEFTGSDFVRILLVTQVEASTYGRNIAKVLAQEETSPARAQTLIKISDQWGALRHEAFRLLKNY